MTCIQSCVLTNSGGWVGGGLQTGPTFFRQHEPTRFGRDESAAEALSALSHFLFK